MKSGIRNRISTRRTGSILRRLRIRFINRVGIRAAVTANPHTIDTLAALCLDRGLYAGNSKSGGARRCVRYSILRTWYKSDCPRDDAFGWYRWTTKNGWKSGTWIPADKKTEAA